MAVQKRARSQKQSQSSKSARKKVLNANDPRPVLDLWVPLPKDADSLPQRVMVWRLLDRLESTGFSHAALTHTVYGRPTPNTDDAESALPDSLWKDRPVTKGIKKANIKVLRRLHVVVENLVDVGRYNGPAIDGYDLVSISPRNDAAFSAACSSALAAQIITLDYTAGRGGNQLPFKIGAVDVRAAIERKAVFEIPYAPAILNRNQRKAIIQTCRELQVASLGVTPQVLVSSGPRTERNFDAGPMALRMPSDVVNLLRTVMHFDEQVSSQALTMGPNFALEQSKRYRFGKSLITDIHTEVSYTDEDEKHLEILDQGNRKTKGTSSKIAEPDGDGDVVIEDGFIAL